MIKFVQEKLRKNKLIAHCTLFLELFLFNKIFFKFFLLTEIFFSTLKEDKKHNVC